MRLAFWLVPPLLAGLVAYALITWLGILPGLVIGVAFGLVFGAWWGSTFWRSLLGNGKGYRL